MRKRNRTITIRCTDDEYERIENQRLMLKEYADKNGFCNCQYYIGDGYSGVNKNRPEYVRMLKDIENGLVGTVIVKEQSRLSRNYLEAGRLMENLFPSYLHRNKKTYNNFMCGRYEKRKSNCTAHYIREEVVDAVVLEAIQRVTKYARERSDEFYEMAMSNGENEAMSRTKNSEALRNEYETKINQLESAISMLYMDRVTGRVTPERYDSLAAGYEKEQSELKAKLQELDSHTSYMAMKEKCVKEFISNAKKYVDVAEVTPQLLRAFIWRIEVYEKAKKRSRTSLNDITVHFSFLADKEIKLDGIMIETFKI